MEERRKDLRYNMFDYPVLISDNETDWEKANLVNISGTGAMIKCNSYFPCENLYLELPRPFVKVLGSYFIKCDVLWSKNSCTEEGICEYGVRFEKYELEETQSVDLDELLRNS